MIIGLPGNGPFSIRSNHFVQHPTPAAPATNTPGGS